MTRLEANRELVKLLTKLVELNSDLRWHQLLLAYGFIRNTNQFYEESENTLIEVVELTNDLIKK